jgi:hypothetical protein
MTGAALSRPASDEGWLIGKKRGQQESRTRRFAKKVPSMKTKAAKGNEEKGWCLYT